MICFVNFTLANKYSVLKRKALSVRDIINLVEFLHATQGLFQDLASPENRAHALYHAVSLVILDGLCLGIDVAGESQQKLIFSLSSTYL